MKLEQFIAPITARTDQGWAEMRDRFNDVAAILLSDNLSTEELCDIGMACVALVGAELTLRQLQTAIDFASGPSQPRLRERLQELIDDGLTFEQCVEAFEDSKCR